MLIEKVSTNTRMEQGCVDSVIKSIIEHSSNGNAEATFHEVCRDDRKYEKPH